MQGKIPMEAVRILKQKLSISCFSKKDKNANVLILGRNNKDFEDIEMDQRIFIDFKASDDTKTVVKCTYFPNMKLSYSTVHGSKGLEEDYVILINADDNRIGFLFLADLAEFFVRVLRCVAEHIRHKLLFTQQAGTDQ